MRLAPLVTMLYIIVLLSCALEVSSKDIVNEVEGTLQQPTEFCKTYAYNQTIREYGCETKYINNNACYGQCHSKFREGILTCAACWPTVLEDKVVTLKCRGGVIKKITVEIFGFCQCSHRRCPTPTMQNAIELPATTSTMKKNKLLRRKRRRCKRKKGMERKLCLRRLRNERRNERSRQAIDKAAKTQSLLFL